MAQAKDAEHEHADKYRLVNTESETSKEFSTWQDAQERLNTVVNEFPELQPDDLRIEPVYTDGGSDATQNGDSEEPVERVEAPPADEPPQQPTEAVENQSEAQVVKSDTTPVVTDSESLPKISPVEDTARQVIGQLNADDMHRLVWDPDADPASVPYDVRGLPYDRPEPSAEAFDLFAGIIEGAQDVQYSVEDVSFTETDKTYGCTVVIEKHSEQGRKRLVGIKTRQKNRTTGIDHWRERLYSKGRRNALKQDIPPTMVSSLLARYREVANE